MSAAPPPYWQSWWRRSFTARMDLLSPFQGRTGTMPGVWILDLASDAYCFQNKMLAAFGCSLQSCCHRVPLFGQVPMLRKAGHRLLELRVHFVGDGHYVGEHQGQIHGAEIVAQGLENAYLKDPRFFNQHGRGITLLISYSSMGQSCHRNLRLALIEVRFSESLNQFYEQRT